MNKKTSDLSFLGVLLSLRCTADVPIEDRPIEDSVERVAANSVLRTKCYKKWE